MIHHVLHRIFVLLAELGAIEPVPGHYPPGLASRLAPDSVRDECFAAELADCGAWCPP